MEAATFQELVSDFTIGVMKATHKNLKNNIFILKENNCRKHYTLDSRILSYKDKTEKWKHNLSKKKSCFGLINILLEQGVSRSNVSQTNQTIIHLNQNILAQM